MPKSLDVRLWEKYANIYVTHEVGPVNDVARITLHRWHQVTTTMQDNNDEATDRLHRLSLPLGQISQNVLKA